MKYVKDLTLALRLISCYCSSLNAQKVSIASKFHGGFEGSRLAQSGKEHCYKKKNKSGNMCSGDGRGTVLLFTEEVVSNNTDILALIFYHYYSSRKGKGLPITCHEDTAGKQIYSFAHS